MSDTIPEVTEKARKVLEEAMELSAGERADIAAELLKSLPNDGLHPDWAAELERRARAPQEPDAGEPWETVEERLRSRPRPAW